MLHLLRVGFVVALVSGCGHVEDEWRRQVRANEDLRAKLASEHAKTVAAASTEEAASQRLETLEKDLRDAGIDPAAVNASREAQARVMAEHLRRAALAELLQQRLRELEAKLGQEHLPIAVTTRRGFASLRVARSALRGKGPEPLTPAGRQLLTKLVGVLRESGLLAARDVTLTVHAEATPSPSQGAALASALVWAGELHAFLTAPPNRSGAGLDRAHLRVGAALDDASEEAVELVLEPTRDEWGTPDAR